MFGLVDGAKMEKSVSASQGIQPIPSAPRGKDFNFLPKGFHIRSETNPDSVKLPDGHALHPCSPHICSW